MYIVPSAFRRIAYILGEPRTPADAEYARLCQGRTRTISEYLERLRPHLRALHKVVLEKANKSHQNKLIYDAVVLGARSLYVISLFYDVCSRRQEQQHPQAKKAQDVCRPREKHLKHRVPKHMAVQCTDEHYEKNIGRQLHLAMKSRT